MTEIHRRHALYLAGCGMAALAGCSESSSDESDDGEGSADGAADEYEGTIETGDLPSYASVLPEIDSSEYFYGAIDIDTMFDITDDDGNQTGDEPADPLVVNPVVFAILGYDGVEHLSTLPAADPYRANDATASGEGQLVYANDVYALVGENDRAGLEADLEDAGYDAVDGDGSHAIYAHGETGGVVGVTDEVFAFPDPTAVESSADQTTAVRRLIETAIGAREPKHAGDDEFEWLLRAGGNSGITTGVYTDADEFDPTWLGADQSSDESETFDSEYGAFEGAYGATQQLVVSGDDGASAGAVVTYADADRVDIDRLESSLGTEAETVDVTRDETAVSVDAEYADDL